MGFESMEEMRSRSPRELMGDYLVTDEHGRELRMEDLPSVRLLRGESVIANFKAAGGNWFLQFVFRLLMN